MTGPRLEQPYIVCDRCGHLWTVWGNHPAECENCSHPAFWSFPSVEKAVDHSRLIRDRL